MKQIFFVSVFFCILLSVSSREYGSRAKNNNNVENKSALRIGESDDSQAIENSVAGDVETGRQTLTQDFQDIVNAFKGVYKFYDSFSIKDDEDKPQGKNKPNDKKNPKKKLKKQKPKKPDGIDRIDTIETSEKPNKKENKLKNEKKKKNKENSKKPQKAKEPEENAPGLNLSQLFRREMRKLWTQLTKYVTENFYNAFE